MMRNLILYSLLLVIVSSCGYQKQRYLKDIAKLKPDTLLGKATPNYKIQPSDVLNIRVVSLNKEVFDLFNSYQASNQTQGVSFEANAYTSGFPITDSGLIKLPMVGDIYVKDLTVDEARKLIQTKIDNVVQDATVFVRLAIFKIAVLGEVGTPGMKYIFSPRVSLLEVMAMAGDVKDLGDRRNVLIIRPLEKGHLTYRVDLTDPKLIAGNAFPIMPNDVIYVEARRSKGFQLNWQNVSIVLSAITTFLILFTFVKSTR